MFSANKIVCIIVFVAVYRLVLGDTPNFRVLAPEFVCPNNEEAIIEKPDNTIITVKTDAPDLQLSWIVRWTNLVKPSQRLTLFIWKSVRALETKLNSPQPEPYVYVIDNAELLQGVEYVFNVTATNLESENSTFQTFAIDNIKGDPTLLIEGRSEKLSVLLLGTETMYADMEYMAEAKVTTCTPTQDYYFAWNVRGSSSSSWNAPDTSGSRLEIPPYSLPPGNYLVSCVVYRNSGEFVTQTSLPLQVLCRGLAVNINFDILVVTLNNKFDVTALVENHDYYGDIIKFEWSCTFETKPCENIDSTANETVSFSHGLPVLGRYEIVVITTVQGQKASSNATIIVIEPTLPILQIEPIHRIVNEHTMIKLVANASNVAPTCTLTWYFANDEYLTTLDHSCEDCKRGVELPGSVTITSLEEVFLNELTDFTNETESRQVEAETKAESGRARFVAQCGCSLTFNCETQGIVYADVYFTLNESPTVSEIKVTPESGTAMETVFRLSTLAAIDPDKPLLYSFYCSLGEEKLMLASNIEDLATETFLPFVGKLSNRKICVANLLEASKSEYPNKVVWIPTISDETGTKIWVEVCDSLGACSSSEPRIVQLLAGVGRTVQALVASLRGHVARCEVMLLKRLVQSAIITYTNTNLQGVLSTFIKAVSDSFLEMDKKHCLGKNNAIQELINLLDQVGVDIDRSVQ